VEAPAQILTKGLYPNAYSRHPDLNRCTCRLETRVGFRCRWDQWEFRAAHL